MSQAKFLLNLCNLFWKVLDLSAETETDPQDRTAPNAMKLPQPATRSREKMIRWSEHVLEGSVASRFIDKFIDEYWTIRYDQSSIERVVVLQS